MTRLTATLVGFVALAPLAILAGCGSSNGDSGSATTDEDKAFITRLHSHGSEFSQDFAAWTNERLVLYAYEACNFYKDGNETTDIGVGLVREGFEPADAVIFLSDATESYCPEYSD